jgi:GSCFA family
LRFVTVGSCFAANLSNALVYEGVAATTLTIGEQINSTFANRAIFEWAFGDHEKAQTNHPFVTGYDRAKIAEEVKLADVLVYTLGVSPSFFDKDSGQFVLPDARAAVRGLKDGKLVYRHTSPDENASNILRIVELIRSVNPFCKIILTVSPVPLNTSFDESSAIEADCISKSTLRVAAAQVVRQIENCYYWPSFEIIRWLGAYVPGMYGADDGTTLHVSEHIISTIIRLFLSRISEQDAAQLSHTDSVNNSKQQLPDNTTV